MNKRISEKISKRENTKSIENVLALVEKDFAINEKILCDGYFLFTFGSNSVCHFTIKELPDWKFGIWLNGSYRSKYKIFGEHIDLIDKFKPSKTYISFTENEMSDFVSTVKNVITSPKEHFVRSMLYIGFNESISQEKVDKEYDEHLADKKQEEEMRNKAKSITFNYFPEILNKYEEVKAVLVIDRDASWSPRYKVDIIGDKNVSDARFEEIYDEIREASFDIHKDTYCYGHSFDIDGIYDDNDVVSRKDKMFRKYHYKYFKDGFLKK